MMKGMRGDELFFVMFGSDSCFFRILLDNPDLMEDPLDEDSECGSSDADDNGSDDSSAEQEDFCKADDCNDNAPRTLGVLRKRRKIA